MIELNVNQYFNDQTNEDKEKYKAIVEEDNNNTNDNDDDKEQKHPERKFKQIYRKYVDDQMPILKKEYPRLKRSQLLQMIYKDFQKSELNPFNNPKFVAHNQKIQ